MNYTTPFISQCKFDYTTVLKHWEGNECKTLYYRLTEQGTFDQLKEHEAFNTLLEELAKFI